MILDVYACDPFGYWQRRASLRCGSPRASLQSRGCLETCSTVLGEKCPQESEARGGATTERVNLVSSSSNNADIESLKLRRLFSSIYLGFRAGLFTEHSLRKALQSTCQTLDSGRHFHLLSSFPFSFSCPIPWRSARQNRSEHLYAYASRTSTEVAHILTHSLPGRRPANLNST